MISFLGGNSGHFHKQKGLRKLGEERKLRTTEGSFSLTLTVMMLFTKEEMAPSMLFADTGTGGHLAHGLASEHRSTATR